ncbi:cell division cycle protein 14 [Arctopsyche grandis]|uniref:cell division cycle protein 14 n=1 Tax=Arctopsyche grandis TaxID=121162 RepID=UPI00406D746F
MDENDVIISSTEIIPDKLYFATLECNYKPKSTKNSKYFHIEDEIVYESFYLDYGPYHLCHLYFFCTKLNGKLAKAPKSRKIVFYTSDDNVLRLNAAYLIGSYAIIYLKLSAKAAYDLVTGGSHWELLTFRDASAGSPLFEISLLDVFQGLHKAFNGGFFNFQHFNFQEYMYYEKVLNGDLNWIIPDKMLAFSGPHSQSRLKDDYPLHAPDHYHQYFKDNNVTCIVRLNQKSYNAKQFTEFGFEHHELFFLDGSAPSDIIVDKFNKISEETKGAVAVHCKAGLGRTGTLIACYMMKHLGFTACQAISWLRICRPGSVIGFQQRFLQETQSRMLSEGEVYRRKRGVTSIPKFKRGIYSRTATTNTEDVENANFIESNSNSVSLDDLENVPAGKPAICRLMKLDTDTELSTAKQNKDDFVSLDSIINSSQLNTMESRAVAHKTRANTALANAKNSYTSNKNNYMMSNASTNSKSMTVKVQTTYTPKKLQTTTSTIGSTNLKPTSLSSKSSVMHPVKMTIAKSQCGKSTIHSPRANLARNYGQAYPHSASPLKTYARKAPNSLKSASVPTHLKSTLPNFVDTPTSHSKDFDSNLNLVVEAPRKVVANMNNSPAKLVNDIPKKKVILRKKPLRVATVDEIKDMKNCNISNSDSEKDSTNTTLTNISADSLENIPCKMPTRRTKSKSPEPMHHIAENLQNDDVEEGIDSQGSKLCKIKASRKKVATFVSNNLKKDGVKTRNYSTPPAVKKK